MKALKTLRCEPHIKHIAPLYIVADDGHLFKALIKSVYLSQNKEKEVIHC
jgi:hypothetical protein